MLKRTLISALFVFCFVLVGIPGFAAEFSMKFSSTMNQGHSWSRAADLFKQYVEENSNGRISIEVFPANALGSNREVLEMIKFGTVDFMNCGVTHVSNNVPEFNVLVLPYLWTDNEKLFAGLNGAFGQDLASRTRDRGFELMGWLDNGFRDVTSKVKPIVNPGDIKGLKIRCLPSKVHMAFFRALGAAPSPVAWSELYQALQQGLVDAQENPPATIYFARFQEVQKYYSKTGHANEPGLVIMSNASMKKLPRDLQLLVRVAAQKASEWQKIQNGKDNAQSMEELKKAGMEVNDVPPATIEAFRKVAQSVYSEAIESLGKDGKSLVDVAIFYNK
ncbi:MAG: TRAP transporter substrate-binding protein [Desulfovibrio sp.]|jgi:tripartite ATP-independent transporter DctP family solute receptor|nr:TRAP transporter substrate-binding protein [Desulfovibrio sp.]